MARTTAEIYNIILTEKAKYSSLNSLDNTSDNAIWRTIYYVVAVTIAAFEQIMDLFQAELLEKAKTLPVGTTQWYAQKALEYQEGYTVVYNRDNGSLQYEVEDPDAKIVKVSSCVTEGGNIIIKVAKDNGIGGLTNLDTSELQGVTDYFQTIKVIGPVLRVRSLAPDLIQLDIKIKTDKTIINSLGQSTTNTDVYPVEDAINLYLSSFSLTSFNSELQIVKLIDAIQQVNGVLNINITKAKAKQDTGVVYIDILTSDMLTYNSIAGYITPDPAYTLRDHIIYI